jgi:hypothetical protein
LHVCKLDEQVDESEEEEDEVSRIDFILERD